MNLVDASLPPGAAGAQPAFSAYRAAEGIAQPHLLDARRLADQDNFWKTPALNACYLDDGALSQQIIKDPPATKAMDNLIFLGTGNVSAWAVNTSDGIILIDSLNDQAEADKYIIGGLKAVGLDPSTIKIIVLSHAHADHFGGAAYLQAKYGARVYMSAADWAYLPGWLKGPYARGRIFDLPRQDGAIKDGDTLTLGDTTIRMFLTPGHTPGALSMLIPLTDKGQPHTFVFEGGVSSSNNLTSDLHRTFDQGIDRLISAATQAGADGYMANHGNFDDVARKAAHVRANPKEPNPFVVGPEATQRWLRIVKECNLNNRDVDAALAARKSKVGG